ncbi:CLUMA_CG009161, isoform A [Clunio marinus]|uniref:CLUMA_CG009161, isoform A n=1 Tax=Clunio marinus TaxID=568069 RepID=A0A1J1I5U7_9DIPT|nr:CLUMA_CG009161, isoform A [Clunio marinus]
MSSKEIKALLKEAREAIKEKDYQLAIQKCKEILINDKKNGMAYILLGAAFQETNKSEAVKYLRCALDCQGDYKLLSLQGLSNCVKPDELTDVIEQLLQLAPEKYLECYAKLSNVTHQISDQSQLINFFCHEIKSDDNDRKYQALKHLLNVFMKNRELAAETYKDEYLECLEIGIQDKNHLHHFEICRDYFKLLHQKRRFEDLTRKAEEISSVYENNVMPLEWICKIYIENEDFPISQYLKSNFGLFVERLLELNPNSVIGLMASALVKLVIGDLGVARDILVKVNLLKPNWSLCLKKLSSIHIRLRAHLLAELVFRQLKDCDVDLAENLIEQQTDEKINGALEIIERNEDERCLVLKTKAQIYLQNFEIAQDLVSRLKLMNFDTRILQATMLRFKGENLEAVNILQDLEDHEANLERGRNLFALKKFDDSLLSILKATKLDSTNSECFFWLGRIYVAINDEVRSRKCFEKCLSLNPQNEKAITFLSAIYRKNKNWDENLAMLENSVKSVDGHHQKSASFQLGLHHLSQQNFDNAITSFRNALKYDPNNEKCWESLADSYFGRGSYASALKVFEKSVEINSKNSYAKLLIAKIKFILQQYQESIEDYNKLLIELTDYLPALKGLAESHFGRAYYLHENHRSGRARNHCQESLQFLEKAIQIEPNFLCLWRMLANILEFVGSLPKLHSHLIIPGTLICEDKSRKLHGDDLLNLAGKCYSRCLKLHHNDEFVWFELVANYYKIARRSVDNDGRLDHLKLAFEGAKHLVKLSPHRWQNWNILGVVASSKEINDPALAQHSFIKAISLDKKTYTSWNNLGVFYLMQNDIKLGNKAFSRAQQSDTTFLNAWIGQSIIAEMIGDQNEAMDLFRHCTQLGFHYESSIGYSNHVCSILNESNYANDPKYEYAIDKMFAIPLALDHALWHTLLESDQTSFEAWNFVGYLSGKQGLWTQAITAYENGLKLLENGIKKDSCLTDLGYCYLKVGRNSVATKAFMNVKEATFTSTIGLALAFYKDKNYEQCYETYQKAVEWLASSDEEKAAVLVAMSAMVYAFKGTDDAKMVLFQCIGLPSPPIQGLFSLCAISLLHKDKELSNLVIKELRKFEKDPEHGHEVAFMVAQYHILHTSKADAISYVSERIHEYPERPFLRNLLANLLIESYQNDEKLMMSASRMAQSSLSLRYVGKSGISSQEAAQTLALASKALKTTNQQKAKLLAQECVHINPHYWKNLKNL